MLSFILYILLRWLIRLLYSIFFLNLTKKLFKKQIPIENHLNNLEKSLGVNVFFLSIIGFIVGGFIKIFLLSKSLALNMNFVEVVLATSIVSIIGFIPISYLGIGTRDVGMLAAFQLFGNSKEEAIALSFALLLFRIAIIFVGAIFWFFNPPVVNDI
jgi:uncharacterized membrane protein YbhN (UPF0104 family)